MHPTFEAIKIGLKQDKNGYVLTLSIHPDDLDDAIMRDFVGSRYMVVMVRIGDDEQPLNRADQYPGDHAVKTAGILCRNPEFWDWLEENENIEKKSEVESVLWLVSFLGINSRKELKTNAEARILLNRIKEKFESWQAN